MCTTYFGHIHLQHPWTSWLRKKTLDMVLLMSLHPMLGVAISATPPPRPQGDSEGQQWETACLGPKAGEWFHYNLLYVMSWQEIQICRDSWSVAGWSGIWEDLGSEPENEWQGRIGRGGGLDLSGHQEKTLVSHVNAHSCRRRTLPAKEVSTTR